RSDARQHWKPSRLGLSDVHSDAQGAPGVDVCRTHERDHGLDGAFDEQLLALCKPALEAEGPVEAELDIHNVHRTAGPMLCGVAARRFGQSGLPDGTIRLHFKGSAGQSFGAFLTHGIEFSLSGDANDYVGKGMSGGLIAVRPGAGAEFEADQNIIIG